MHKWSNGHRLTRYGSKVIAVLVITVVRSTFYVQHCVGAIAPVLTAWGPTGARIPLWLVSQVKLRVACHAYRCSTCRDGLFKDLRVRGGTTVLDNKSGKEVAG